MIVYAETNFVLELVRLQEGLAACKALIEFCREGMARLVIPAFSLVEPYGTLERSRIKRDEPRKAVSDQHSQLVRTQSYKDQIGAMGDVTALSIGSIDDERSRLDSTLAELLDLAETIHLEPKVLASAFDYRKQYRLESPDAMVLSSVISHLETQSPETSCFLEKDANDFNDPDIVWRIAKKLQHQPEAQARKKRRNSRASLALRVSVENAKRCIFFAMSHS